MKKFKIKEFSITLITSLAVMIMSALLVTGLLITVNISYADSFPFSSLSQHPTQSQLRQQQDTNGTMMRATTTNSNGLLQLTDHPFPFFSAQSPSVQLQLHMQQLEQQQQQQSQLTQQQPLNTNGIGNNNSNYEPDYHSSSIVFLLPF